MRTICGCMMCCALAATACCSTNQLTAQTVRELLPSTLKELGARVVTRGELLELQAQFLGPTQLILASRNASLKESKNPGTVSSIRGLTTKDLELIRTAIPTLLRSTPVREMTLKAKSDSVEATVLAIATTPDALTDFHLTLSLGRFVSDSDFHRRERVAVLSDAACQLLLPRQAPIGKSIELGGTPFTVIGVLKRADDLTMAVGRTLTAPGRTDLVIYLPFRTELDAAPSLPAGAVPLDRIHLVVSGPEQVTATAQAVEAALQPPKIRNDYAITLPIALAAKASKLPVNERLAVVGVDLTGVNSADQWLSHLPTLGTLEFVLLGNTDVTDSGFQALSASATLRCIVLRNTRVSAQAVSDFQKVAPQCVIVR